MTAPDVVVVDHYDSYTWNLVHLIAQVTGIVPRVVEHDRVDAAEVLQHRHVVLSPGPGHPDNVGDFAVGRAVLTTGTRPVLGVCLGMQGLVTAYGGTLTARDPAHGVVSSIEHDGTGLFAGLPQGFDAVRYHSLQVASVPDALDVIATSGGVVMAVQHRELPLVGVQFHPESILSEHGATMIERFLEWA